MDEQFTRVTTVKESQTTSTITTGDQTWAPTGLFLQNSLHPRSQEEETNWQKMISQLFVFQQAVVSSPNMEHLDSTCVDDIHEKSSFKPFLVKSRLGWLEDK